MKTHAQSLHALARNLSWLLMFRSAVAWVTGWFFLWGVVVLAARFTGWAGMQTLVLGLLVAIPLAFTGAAVAYRRRVAFAKVRAAYDGLNHCGGLIMSQEAADMSAWNETLPGASTPSVRWRSGKAMGLLGVSTAFVAVTLLLPDRLTTLAGSQPLEIGQLVGELQAEVETLKEEKILEPEKADDLQRQLERIQQEASARDPNRTWEALDHLKEANSDLARQAAEEALSKTSRLTEAETLANALNLAAESGMGPDTATRAAQDLLGLLKSAQVEEGLLKGDLPPDLLSQLDALSKEDMDRLLSAIQFNKTSFGKTITNLARLKLIDAKLLGECNNAGECFNPDALVAFLCSGTNSFDSFSQLVMSYCRGGVDRGRGDAPMTWTDGSSEEGAKFKEEALPSSMRLSDSQFVGVSRTAPELSGESVTVEHGALASAQSSGGAAHAQVILPRHKQTVQRFFNREE